MRLSVSVQKDDKMDTETKYAIIVLSLLAASIIVILLNYSTLQSFNSTSKYISNLSQSLNPINKPINNLNVIYYFNNTSNNSIIYLNITFINGESLNNYPFNIYKNYIINQAKEISPNGRISNISSSYIKILINSECTHYPQNILISNKYRYFLINKGGFDIYNCS